MDHEAPDKEVRVDPSRGDPAWTPRTVWSVLLAHSKCRPDKEFIVGEDAFHAVTRRTYADMEKEARALSVGLFNAGVRRGDRVALWMTNLPEFVESYFAVLRLGAVLVPISTFLRAEEVAYVLRKSAARHLIMLDQYKRIRFGEILSEIATEWQTSAPGNLYSAKVPDLRTVIVYGRVEPVDRSIALDYKSLGTGGAEVTAAVQELVGAVQPADLGLIKFTSGSTGVPKGVRLHQWGLITNGLLHTRRLGTTEHDKYFSQMPMFHVGGNIWGLMSTLTVGGTLVFGESSDGAAATRLIESERCTVFIGAPPTEYDMIRSLQVEPRDLSSIRISVTREKRVKAELWGGSGALKFMNPFGMTETYGPITLPGENDAPDRWATNGYPLDGVEIRIVDATTGDDCPTGVVGEILFRGLVTSGYHDAPDQLALDPAGWLHTEDLGTLDDKGYLTYVGRLKAMLKVGGENVAVEEVENVILSFPSVGQVCVIGVPDSRKGEVPRAILVLDTKTDMDPDAVVEELRQYVSRRLARFKVPRDFVVLQSLPLTGSGKIDRAEVARLYAETDKVPIRVPLAQA
jgi:fatty-acyl-CoA synthase